MYSNISQTNAYNASATSVSAPLNGQGKKLGANSYVQNPITKPSFTSQGGDVALNTRLNTKEDTRKYSVLIKNLDKEGRKSLDLLLKTGILLKNNSNDKTSTLDSLYKMATTQRCQGLDNPTVLSETVKTLANPYIITQQFGDMYNEFGEKAIEVESKNSSNLIERKIAKNNVNVEHSGTCVSASIEFNLANKMPAEFARIAEALTSPAMAVQKNISIKNLTEQALDAVWLLNAFEIPYKMDNFDNAQLTLAPDKNAYIRAQMQAKYKDAGERSLIDVLMQSTFMNIGSQQSYNSLTDKRQGKFNQNDAGLIEFEKTFTESIVEDKNKTSITYQVLDDNERLVGYETDFNTMKKHITDTLAMGENIIIGYTQTDESNKIVNGHEITIVGTRTGDDGKTIFICNDTDDNNPNPIEYGEDYLIPKIHHAGLPQKVVENDVKYVESWTEGMKAYKEQQKQNLATPSKEAHV